MGVVDNEFVDPYARVCTYTRQIGNANDKKGCGIYIHHDKNNCYPTYLLHCP